MTPKDELRSGWHEVWRRSRLWPDWGAAGDSPGHSVPRIEHKNGLTANADEFMRRRQQSGDRLAYNF